MNFENWEKYHKKTSKNFEMKETKSVFLFFFSFSYLIIFLNFHIANFAVKIMVLQNDKNGGGV